MNMQIKPMFGIFITSESVKQLYIFNGILPTAEMFITIKVPLRNKVV